MHAHDMIWLKIWGLEGYGVHNEVKQKDRLDNHFQPRQEREREREITKTNFPILYFSYKS